MRTWVALLGALAALVPGAARATGVVHVPAEVAVDGSTIALGDIALFDGVPPEAEERLAALSFGALENGARTQLAGARLREAILAVDPSITVDVPEHVSVRSASETLSREVLQQRIEQAIRQRMPWPADSVRFERWSLPDGLSGPPGAVRLAVGFRPREDFRNRVSVSLELSDPTRPQLRPVQRSASVELLVHAPVAVAARALRRGEVLEADAVRFETMELRRLPADVLTNVDQALGQHLAVPVRAGSPLSFSYFAGADLVRRGETLVVDASQGGLELHIEARALEPGKLGQVIRALNPSSRREFPVEVTGAREARLALPLAERFPGEEQP